MTFRELRAMIAELSNGDNAVVPCERCNRPADMYLLYNKTASCEDCYAEDINVD